MMVKHVGVALARRHSASAVRLPPRPTRRSVAAASCRFFSLLALRSFAPVRLNIQRNIALHYITVHFSSVQLSSLQFISVHFSSVHYSSLQFITVHYSSLQFIPVHSSSFQFIPVHSSSFQFIPVHSSSVRFSIVQYGSVRFSTVHHGPFYSMLRLLRSGSSQRSTTARWNSRAAPSTASARRRGKPARRATPR